MILARVVVLARFMVLSWHLTLNQITFALSSWQTCPLQAILHPRIPGGVFAYQYKTGILSNTHNVWQNLAKSCNHDEQ